MYCGIKKFAYLCSAIEKQRLPSISGLPKLKLFFWDMKNGRLQEAAAGKRKIKFSFRFVAKTKIHFFFRSRKSGKKKMIFEKIPLNVLYVFTGVPVRFHSLKLFRLL